jgi:hypothetical protein
MEGETSQSNPTRQNTMPDYSNVTQMGEADAAAMGPLKLVVTDPVSGRAMSDEEIEKGVAATFGQLSFEERHHALHDIHGVAEPMEETQHLVATSLAKLECEIQLMISNNNNNNNKSAYEIALSKSPEYVTAHDFRMKFLRAEQFDVTKAARRLIYHFEKKLELFGEEVLGREVRWSDLSNEDIAVLQSGYVRLLPLRDRSGRLVLFHARSLCPYMTIATRVRVLYFVARICRISWVIHINRLTFHPPCA